MAAKADRNDFLASTREDGDLNQYWYSSATIKAMCAEITRCGGRVAFLSTPSVYHSLLKYGTPEQQAAADVAVHALLDFDDQWKSDPMFYKWDFNHPTTFPATWSHAFDMVVIDPPFITREVWEKYSEGAKALLVEGDFPLPPGKVLASTIQENAPLMLELLGATPQRFLPSIPNLVYQYNFFCNFPTTELDVANPEIPE